LGKNGVKEFKVIPFVIDVQNTRIREAGQADAQAVMEYFK
jgi:hypothetical protein